MEKKQESNGGGRRKFLIQAAGGTLAVGFGAGLTSCVTPGGGSGDWTLPKGSTLYFEYKFKAEGWHFGPGFSVPFEGFGFSAPSNNNNNGEEVTVTYDSLTDSYLAENLTQEDIICVTYGLD